MSLEKVVWSFSKLKCFEQCPRKYQHLYELKDVKDAGNQYTEAGTRDHESLERRLTRGTTLPSHLAHLEPTCAQLAAAKGELLTERKWALTIQLAPTEWMARDVWVRLIIDLALVKGRDALVLDWKTGKRDPDPTQLSLFALGVMQHYPAIERVTTGYVWTRDGTMDRDFYGRADIPAIFNQLAPRVQEIATAQQQSRWIKLPSRLCDWCPVKKAGKCDG